MPSIREMCDPRVQIAAKICLENNFCKDCRLPSDHDCPAKTVSEPPAFSSTIDYPKYLCSLKSCKIKEKTSIVCPICKGRGQIQVGG